MTQEETVALTKRNVINCIYSNAQVEGIGVTFPQTAQIFEGWTVDGVQICDVNKIVNLKRAWGFIFDSLNYELDLSYLRQLNVIINTGFMPDAGLLRNYNVQIGGTDWTPELPEAATIQKDLELLMRTECITMRALKIMLYIMRAQMFGDGNKRVAQLAANQILVSKGKGYLRIPPTRLKEFIELLIEFYETNDDVHMLKFLYDNAVYGKEILREPEKIEDLDQTKFLDRFNK